MNIIAIGKGNSAYFIDTITGIKYGKYCPVCNQTFSTSDKYDWSLHQHVKTHKHQNNNENSHKNDIIECLSRKNEEESDKKIISELSNIDRLWIFILWLILMFINVIVNI